MMKIHSMKFLAHLAAAFPGRTVFPKKELTDLWGRTEFKPTQIYHDIFRPENRGAERGVYDLTALLEGVDPVEMQLSNSPAVKQPRSAPVTPAPTANFATSVAEQDENIVFVPAKDPSFVKWGDEYPRIEKIIGSGQFFPIYISGLSGNGKTFMVEQICAQSKREMVRVQISPETDENDLIGGYGLSDGNTVFNYGPVIHAMKRGAVLLIDEIDRATNKIMCLQGILEGKPVVIKKTNELIIPAPGFTVVATANTTGRGSSDGRYTAASIIDDAFLERFTITINQEFPPRVNEKRILIKHMDKFGTEDKDFADKLSIWSEVIRRTYAEGGVDELISTRRLCHIVQTWSILQDKMESITLCLNRYDEESRAAFTDLYTKIDADPAAHGGEETPESQTVTY